MSDSILDSFAEAQARRDRWMRGRKPDRYTDMPYATRVIFARLIKAGNEIRRTATACAEIRARVEALPDFGPMWSHFHATSRSWVGHKLAADPTQWLQEYTCEFRDAR